MNRNEINTMIKVVYNACVQNKEKDYLDNDYIDIIILKLLNLSETNST